MQCHLRSLAALLLVAALLAAPILVLAPDLGWPEAGGAPAAAAAWLRTLRLAGLTALLALALGLPGARVLAGCGPRRLRWLAPLVVLPLILPLPLAAIAWIGLAGRQGPANRALSAAFGLAEPPLGVYNLPVAALVLALAFWPCVALAGAAGLRTLARSGFEAAVLARGRAVAWWSVARPALAPYFGWAAVAAGLLAATEISVPAILQVEVGAMYVFTRFERDFDISAAVRACLPFVALGVAGVVALAVLGCGLPARPVAPSGGRTGAGPGPAGALPWTLLAAVLALSVALPSATFLLETRAAAILVETVHVSARQIGNTISFALAAATAAVALALAVAFVLPRPAPRLWVAAIVLVAGLPFLLPGAFTGIGLIRLANLPLLDRALYGQPLLVVVACAARYGVLALGLVLLARVAVPDSAVEAARLAGAGPLRVFRSIVVPALLPAAAAAVYLVYALAAGELSSVQLIAPPGCDTVPMRLFALIHYQYESKVAALAAVQLAIVFLPGVAALALLARRAGRLAEGT